MNATLLQTHRHQSNQYGYKFLTFSSVWNVHNSNIGESKNSNVYIDAMPFVNDGKKVVAVIGAKGRSQHSKSEVLLFDASNSENHYNFYFTIHEVN